MFSESTGGGRLVVSHDHEIVFGVASLDVSSVVTNQLSGSGTSFDESIRFDMRRGDELTLDVFVLNLSESWKESEHRRSVRDQKEVKSQTIHSPREL